jgi:peptidyl-prolyl cis-trans isomerase B (cyclophilin B)
MAVFQKLIITLLTLLTFTFLFFAQAAEAAGKGPRITNKVWFALAEPTDWRG